MSMTPMESFVRSVIAGDFNQDMKSPLAFEYWHDKDAGQAWFKKDCMLDRFREFQDAGLPPKQEDAYSRKWCEASVERLPDCLGLHIRESCRRSKWLKLKHGSGYFVFDLELARFFDQKITSKVQKSQQFWLVFLCLYEVCMRLYEVTSSATSPWYPWAVVSVGRGRTFLDFGRTYKKKY